MYNLLPIHFLLLSSITLLASVVQIGLSRGSGVRELSGLQMMLLGNVLSLLFSSYFWNNYSGLWLISFILLGNLGMMSTLVALLSRSAGAYETPKHEIFLTTAVQSLPKNDLLKKETLPLPRSLTRILNLKPIQWVRRIGRVSGVWLFSWIEIKFLERAIDSIAALMFGFSNMIRRIELLNVHHTFMLSMVALLLVSCLALCPLLLNLIPLPV